MPKPPTIRHYPGWIGLFTREEADGAWPNGTRIVKTLTEKGDGHQRGALGTVIGSIQAPVDVAQKYDAGYFYFVEWDSDPRVAVGVISLKIARA